MSEMIRVAPVPGGRVRKPDRQVLASEGERVVRDHYWDRRLLHGDVVALPDKVGPDDAGVIAKGDAK